MKPEDKVWMDNASYAELLRRWRFAPAGDPIFQGDTGEYYQKVMSEKKNALSHEEQVQTSKNLGWR